MRKTTTVVFSLVALALPSANAWAAAQTTVAKTTVKKKVAVATKSFTGLAVATNQWGPMQVTIVVKKTTTTIGTKKIVKRRITSIKVPVSPHHTSRSIFINQQAVPLLTNEVLTMTQFNPNIELVGGATATSYAFAQSLQAAILQAKKI